MRESAPPDDLYGRTALLLLTHLSPDPRVLFMLVSREGVVAFPANGEPRMRRVRHAPDALPFASASFDSVVLDFDEVGVRRRVRTRALQEVDRVLAHTGRCVIVASGRRLPRDRRNWRQYHVMRPPVRRWSASVAATGRFTISATAAARLDQQRLVELTAPSDGHPSYPKGPATDRQILILRRQADVDGPSFLQKLIGELQASLGAAEASVRLERFLVRRIGKTTLVMACEDTRRYVVRVPRSTMAADRARQNFRALRALHSTDLISNQMKAMVPQSRLAGVIGRYPYYVEDSLPGTARDDYREWSSGTGWESGALRFISEMHLATRQPVRIDRQAFDEYFAAPLSRIRRRCSTMHYRAFERVGAILEQAVAGQTVPFVWSHGDFSPGNCLYDAARGLSAVVDWELFSDHHLPLLDVLHCMDIPGERNSHPTWQRFDTIRRLFQPDRLLVVPELASYAEQMSIERRVLPGLILMYWVDHVAKRIDGRAGDAVWMEKRVLQPLMTFDSIEVI